MSICIETTRLTLSPFDSDMPSVQCVREVDAEGRHIGNHQGLSHNPAVPGEPGAEFPWVREGRPAYDSLVTWSEGGGHSCKYSPDEPNRNCVCRRQTENDTAWSRSGFGHKPEDHRWADCSDCGAVHDTTRTGDSRCESCGFWLARVEHFAAGPNRKGERGIRFHDDEFSSGQPRLYGWAPGSSGAFGGLVVTVFCDDGAVLGPADNLWDNGAIPWWLLDRFSPNATVQRGEQVARPGHTDIFGKPLRYTAHPALSARERVHHDGN